VAWTVTFFNDRIEAEILALAPGFVARFIRYAERMELFGPDLGMPHTRAMGGGLFELRIKAAEGLRESSIAWSSTVASSSFTSS
jgi:phage-related protein